MFYVFQCQKYPVTLLGYDLHTQFRIGVSWKFKVIQLRSNFAVDVTGHRFRST